MEKDHLEVILENIDSKFRLVLEGHAALHSEMQSIRREFNERLEHLEFKVDTINANPATKIDAVAADMTAHRACTEAHGPVYRVKENLV